MTSTLWYCQLAYPQHLMPTPEPWTSTPFEFMKYFLVFTMFATLVSGQNAETTEAFCNSLRQPPVTPAWAILEGKAEFRPKGEKTQREAISLRIHMTPAMLRAQLLFGDDERYLVQQVFADGLEGGSVITEEKPGEGALSLAAVGLRANDLMLSFLYWDLVGELPSEKIGGSACRVLQLKHENEVVHVWGSVEHRFPLQVHWYDAGRKDPKRTLRFTDFEALDEKRFWVVKSMTIRGLNWKTRVTFGESRGMAITPSDPIPASLFAGGYHD